MARNTTSGRGTAKAAKKSSSSGDGSAGGTGGNRTLTLVLAGFTGLAILLIAAVAVLGTAGGGGGSADGFTANDQGLIPAGERAPGFSTQTVDGGSVSVDDGAPGEPAATMLVFFATWCPHCNDEAPVLSELEGQYEGMRLVMVGMDGEDTPAEVQSFARRYGIESPAVYDPGLGSEYGISGYPTTYVLNGDGEVVAGHSGEAPREVYEGWIEEALRS